MFRKKTFTNIEEIKRASVFGWGTHPALRMQQGTGLFIAAGLGVFVIIAIFTLLFPKESILFYILFIILLGTPVILAFVYGLYQLINAKVAESELGVTIEGECTEIIDNGLVSFFKLKQSDGEEIWCTTESDQRNLLSINNYYSCVMSPSTGWIRSIQQKPD